MVKFKETTNISLIKHPKLSPGYPSAVQKANVGSKYTYMLQLRNNQHDTWVVRGLSYSATEDILHLVGDAAGHTQTWEFAGELIIIGLLELKLLLQHEGKKNGPSKLPESTLKLRV